ncbi:hypothetical protein LCGC14_0561010 [marine sediment metagenome]|uniref:Uncharacterized protein n=1 Tax=marine sediment metagenome TaxID=412755 RepID=A0A0F9RLX3_9ZZZZ
MYRPKDFNASVIRKRVQMLAANQWSADYEVALVEAGADALLHHLFSQEHQDWLATEEGKACKGRWVFIPND